MADVKTVFTKLFRNLTARKKAVARAGGGTPGKRIKVSPTIKAPKKRKGPFYN